ncbi:MAG: hypothetical protein R3Y35_14665 [Clostridia bacterium]
MKTLEKSYVISLITIAVITAFVAMWATRLGNMNLSTGSSVASCLSACVVVIYGLVKWEKD